MSSRLLRLETFPLNAIGRRSQDPLPQVLVHDDAVIVPRRSMNVVIFVTLL